ncbi:MAG: N-6 DNA methylase, partial [Bacteroidales bacterium]
KKSDDVLFINASEYFEKGKRQNKLGEKDIKAIIDTYKSRETKERYSRSVSIDEIEKNGYNLNISRYVSTAKDDVKIDLLEVNKKLIDLEDKISDASERHNKFLVELGLPLITTVKENEK